MRVRKGGEEQEGAEEGEEQEAETEEKEARVEDEERERMRGRARRESMAEGGERGRRWEEDGVKEKGEGR